MPGTKAGALKARQTNYDKYGADYYQRIGKDGGKASGTGGFYHMKATGQLEKVKQAGAKGGAISKRGPAKKNITESVIPERKSIWAFSR